MRLLPGIAEPDRREPAGFAVLLLVAACAACGRGAETAPEPADTALELFALARGTDPTEGMLEATLDAPPPVDDRAALLDALDLLAKIAEPRVVAVSTPAGPRDAFVDLAAPLSGGGLARYTVRLRAGEDERWRVTWFLGPGVEWPAPRRGRADGLSTSAPPASAR